MPPEAASRHLLRSLLPKAHLFFLLLCGVLPALERALQRSIIFGLRYRKSIMSKESKTSTKEPARKPVVTLRATDVVLGRGHGVAKYSGNVTFREIVWTHKDSYKNARRMEKTAIAKQVVSAVSNLNPPGRFVELDAVTDRYHLVDYATAIEKACQALREKKMAPPKGHVMKAIIEEKLKTKLRQQNFRKKRAASKADKKVTPDPPVSTSSSSSKKKNKTKALRSTKTKKCESTKQVPKRKTKAVSKRKGSTKLQKTIKNARPQFPEVAKTTLPQKTKQASPQTFTTTVSLKSPPKPKPASKSEVPQLPSRGNVAAIGTPAFCLAEQGKVSINQGANIGAPQSFPVQTGSGSLQSLFPPHLTAFCSGSVGKADPIPVPANNNPIATNNAASQESFIATKALTMPNTFGIQGFNAGRTFVSGSPTVVFDFGSSCAPPPPLLQATSSFFRDDDTVDIEAIKEFDPIAAWNAFAAVPKRKW